MKKNRAYYLFTTAVLAIFIALTSIGCPSAGESVTVPPPPETKAEEIVDILHGVDVADPYRWLEDQESAETREWINAQNAYTDEILQQLPGRDELEELFTKLVKIDTINVPTEAGGRYFYSKRTADQDLSVIYFRDGLEGEEKVLIDPHSMSEDNTTSVGIVDISSDGTRVIYSIRKGGVDETSMRIRNVDTGEDLDFELPTNRYYGGATFSPDMSYILYNVQTADGPRTYYHDMSNGSDLSGDALIFGEGYGPEKIVYSSISPNGKWFLASVLHGAAGGNDLYIMPAGNEANWQTVIADGVSNSFAQFADDTLIITTNLDAPKSRVMKADASAANVENWTELIPEQENAVLQGASPTGGYIFASYLKDVQSVIDIYDLDGNYVRDLTFDTIGNIGGGSGRWDSNEAFFTFSSFHIPTTIYRYAVDSGDMEEWAKIEIPIDSDSMELEQVWYESKDGTQIPMFILHKKGIALDGTNPTLLYSYGGFNISLTPQFTDRSAWVEMGGVYAVPNIRGGGEFGEEWHKAGMLGNKQNVFDDFFAAAEYLIDERYTSSDHLGIIGISNGGLLVGASMTQRPDLYSAVVCGYPLLDMIRYHMFMVASFWVPEYGSSEDPDLFQAILDYSPYHNVKQGVDYPATLFVTGDGDTRVAPLHARKMAAMTQAKNSGKNPIMLRYHTKAGHSGGMPASEQIANSVDTYSFLKWRLF